MRERGRTIGDMKVLCEHECEVPCDRETRDGVPFDFNFDR